MTAPTLTQTRLAHGLWEGHLTAPSALPVKAWHNDREITGVTVIPAPGQAGSYTVQVPLPADLIHEGVQTVLLSVDDRVLSQITLIAGVPLEEDLRAEISLLRAELDLLKRAFRRHCSKTAG
jgi:hypothetical protein